MRTILKDVIVGTAIAIMAASCRHPDSTSPRVTERDFVVGSVTGTWARTIGVPGAREAMTLQQSGDRVLGTGNYAIEAGRSGSTAIEGGFVGKTLTLTITRDYGVRETFVGGLEDATRLVGTLASEFGKGEAEYLKQ